VIAALTLILLTAAPPLEPARPIHAPAWSPRKMVGPPDAPPGDNANAWASQAADGGQEWVLLTYAQAVPTQEIRIHENHNPGAVSRVTALVDGDRETTLWEGTAPTKPEPHVFSIKVPMVKADRIKIYLDTTRVSGWNEIDAVELVGADGSRQWVADATASTYYGAGTGSGGPLAELVGRKVRITLAGRTVEGTLQAVEGDFVRVEQSGRALLVGKAAIQTIEW
jgi:hypothetical protein